MSSSPPPSDSPPSSSPPPSSPPPSSPPPSSPPPSSPPPSSPPPSSPPPSSPPPNSSSPSPPPPQDSSNSSPPPPSNSQSSPPPPPTPSPPPSLSDNSGNGEFRSPPPPRPPQSSKDSPSPPPPPRSLSSSSKSSPNSSSSSGGSDSSNVGVIAGVAVGVALVLVVLIAIFVACARKKKKRQQPTSSSYFAESGPQGGQYYNHTPPEHNNNWQTGPKTSDHIVGMSSGNPGGADWPMPPPPPPPHMCSSDMSSNFSGPHGPVLPPPPLPASMAFNKNTFTYDELVVATSGFAQSNLLGQGGFGYVHKGVLPNGKEIAVKCLKSGSGQGDREFQAEVEIISRVHHRHLVSLVGYCIAGGRKLLVYEFLPNNNLEVHLHAKDRPALDWSSRFKIAMGSAKGLAYLHEDCHPRIIHRDIKTSNILLDFNFEPKVSDFGLAKLSQDNNTHVSTRVMGTFGYLAPEYASSGKLTDKSDVFSFGVMLLELITGRRPVDTTGDYMEDSLVDWARPICMRALEDGNYERDHLVDIRLDGDYDKQEMARMVACASASIRHSARRRPKMSQIVRALEGDVSLEDLNEGVKPGQSSYFGGGGSSNASSDYDASSYSADMKQFRKLALDSQNYGSSEYGATSEYGLNPSSSSESSGEISRKGTRLHNNNA